MNFFQYHVELIKALAWPVTVAFLAFMFRADASALLKRIVKGKLAGAEVEFEKRVEDLAETELAAQTSIHSSATVAENGLPPSSDAVAIPDQQIAGAPAKRPLQQIKVPADATKLLRELQFASLETDAVTQSDIRPIILRAWEMLEYSIVALAARYGLLSSQDAIVFGRSISPVAIWKAIHDEVPAALAGRVEHLRLLHDTAARNAEFSPTVSAVINYIRLAKKTADLLDEVDVNPSEGVEADGSA